MTMIYESRQRPAECCINNITGWETKHIIPYPVSLVNLLPDIRYAQTNDLALVLEEHRIWWERLERKDPHSLNW